MSDENYLDPAGPSKFEDPEESNGRVKPHATKQMNASCMSDPWLVPRVLEYLKSVEDQSKDNTVVDIDEIIIALKQRYPEYRRKKETAFRILMQKSMGHVLGSLQKTFNGDSEEEQDDGEADEDIADEEEEEEAAERTNASERIEIVISSDEEDQAKVKPHTQTQATVPNILRKRKTPPERGRIAAVSVKSRQPAAGIKRRRMSSDEENELIPDTTFKDIGGVDKCLKEVCMLLVHMKFPELYQQLGISPPRGILLHGPPGAGKSLLANAIAGELRIPMLKVAATELIGSVSGESEKKIRDVFEKALMQEPCILFIDEVDAIAPHRANAGREMERRVVAQLLLSMDELDHKSRVLVIGATNRPDAIDPALRRAGRFDREVCLGIPDENSRTDILHVLCSKLTLAEDVDLAIVGRLTPGFVGADLASVAREAAMLAVSRSLNAVQSTGAINGGTKCIDEMSLEELTAWIKQKHHLSNEELKEMKVSGDDFLRALRTVQPSAKREGFATVPGVTWDDVGSLVDVREELKTAILAPVKFKDECTTLGLTAAAGVLLSGPPGCGKTLLAKAVANEAGINFISVKGPELLNMYVGESERAVRQCFQRAANSAPCVIFFDEIDALCPRRSEFSEGGVGARVVNQMLTEMDGIEERKGVFLMAATNRPDMVDPAVLRPGRLDKTIYIGLPDTNDRKEILRAITKNGKTPPLSEDVDFGNLAEKTDGFTGADLAALVREASLSSLKTVMNNKSDAPLLVSNDHFTSALTRVVPSITESDKLKYNAQRRK